MKRNFDAEGSSDNEVQQAKIPNQQSGRDIESASRDEGQHVENAEVSQTALATSFSQQDSVLTAVQIETLKGFDKEGMRIVLDKIVGDAIVDYPEALNAISGILESYDKTELISIFQRSPHTLNEIAFAACEGHPDALNAISTKLRSFTKKELKGIFQTSNTTLNNIATAACEGHPGALNAISHELAKFSEGELKPILHKAEHTLNEIAWAACNGHPDALNAISQEVEKFNEEELKGIFQRSPHTLSNIAHAACEGPPDALSAISGQLESFSKEELQGIFQNSPHTLNEIAWAACNGHPDALNAISQELANFSQEELKGIFQRSPHTLSNIAWAACEGPPDALSAISRELAKFSKEELKAIFQNSPHTLNNIAAAAGKGNPDALSAILAPLDGVTGTVSHEGGEYLTYLNGFMQRHLILLKSKSIFLGLERAFCNLGETTFSRITKGVAPEIISQLKKSIIWYKEFTAIFNENASDQADMSGTEFQVQENLSARVCRLINDNFLQRDRDQTSRESRIDFVKNLCDYLTMMDYHHLVLDLDKICMTYQSGLNGCHGSGYADSVLDGFCCSLALQTNGTSFFQASPESDAERDKRYKKAYGMLKSFNQNLGLWIQFKPGRDPLSAQKNVVEHFKLFLRSYLNVLNDGIDDTMDYEQVNEVLTENSWASFKSTIKDFMIEAAVNEADSALMPSGFRP